MEFPHGYYPQTHHHRRNDEEEERREHYPPPPPPSFDQTPPPLFYRENEFAPPRRPYSHYYQESPQPPRPYFNETNYSPPPPPTSIQETQVFHTSSFDQTPPPLFYGENEFAPPPRPYSHYYQESPQPPRPYFNETNYSPPPPPTSIQETQVFHTSHHQGVDPSLDYPPAPTQVTHVSHEQTEARHSFRPHMPSFNHQHTHQPGAASGLDLYNKPSFKVYSKAQPEFHLTIRGGKVILAPSNPSDEFQNWYKDEKYSTRVKDSEGCPAFALVNKATGQAMKHSIGEAHPVQLIPYNPDVLDESILWTESKDLGDGFRAVRMVNNTHLNVDAFHGDKKSGGVHDGTSIVLWKWNKGDNQRWKIIPTRY